MQQPVHSVLPEIRIKGAGKQSVVGLVDTAVLCLSFAPAGARSDGF